jgi:Periplasmic copper-binding protein (NosD)
LVINGNPSLGSVGIWCDACHGTKISDNIIGDPDDAIVVTSDDSSPSPYNGDADDTTITFNRVLGMSPAFPPDGALYICSNGNEISGNQISGTAVGPAIMLDNTCTSTIVTGNNNTVSGNSINEACAGIMRNTGTTGNTISHNRFFNVAKRTATGVACADPPGASPARKARLPELR